MNLTGGTPLLAQIRGAGYLISTITEPSVTTGGFAWIFEAFFWIHSRATFKLSSAPALSLQTVTDIPPSPLRTSV